MIGGNANLRRVCRGRINASRAVCPLHCIIGAAAAGGIYAAPTNRPVRLFTAVKRRGQDPSLHYQPIIFRLPLCRGRGIPRPLRGGVFLLLPYSVMVRYSRQVCRGRIYASRAVCPLYRIAGMAATGGQYPVPTPLSPHLSLYGAHLYTQHKHFFNFFCGVPTCKNGRFSPLPRTKRLHFPAGAV